MVVSLSLHRIMTAFDSRCVLYANLKFTTIMDEPPLEPLTNQLTTNQSITEVITEISPTTASNFAASSSQSVAKLKEFNESFVTFVDSNGERVYSIDQVKLLANSKFSTEF